MAQSYDVFLSYARIDQVEGETREVIPENDRFVARLASEMERAFRARTGQPLRVFLDAREIATAQMWQEHIQRALEGSTLMVAVLTPSYFTSQWCTREWHWFEEQERRRRREGKLDASDALIFPVRCRDLSMVIDPAARRRVEAAKARQQHDLAEVDPVGASFRAGVKSLVADLIQALRRLQAIELPSAEEIGEAARRQAMDQTGHAPPFPPDATRHQRISTRMGREENFVDRLADADRVTILGLTNVRLLGFLEQAIRLKRFRYGPDAFWSDVRVVFANEKLLPYVRDELNAEYPSADAAVTVRSRQMDRGREQVRAFLTSFGRTAWDLFEYPYIPPFVGAFLEMADSSKVAQIATLRPSYRVRDYLFVEFSEMAGEVSYYQAAFDEVVRYSKGLPDAVTFVGVPDRDGRGFYSTETIYRRALEKDNRDSSEWVPAVIICTYKQTSSGAQPLLQIRVLGQVDREIGMVSHISGYVHQSDLEGTGSSVDTAFLLPQSAAHKAATRRLKEVFNADEVPEMTGELRYTSYNARSLYFYLFTLTLPADTSVPATLQPWTVHELLRLRQYQLCSQAERLIERNLPVSHSTLAYRVLGLNLILHGRVDLGERIVHLTHDRGGRLAVLDEVRGLRNAVVPDTLVPGEGDRVGGLGGLQFREFFSWLLPEYVKIGALGAKEELERVRGDARSRDALAELARLHASEAQMRTLPNYGQSD